MSTAQTPWHRAALGLAADLAARPFRGLGVTVLVLDRGVDATHPDLQGKVNSVWEVDAQGKLQPLPPNSDHDQTGHGTAVAGLICASHPEIGVAPDAQIISVVYFRPKTRPFSQLLVALDAVVLAIGNLFADVQIVNLSNGGQPKDAYEFQRIQAALQTLLFYQVLPVVAVGNQRSKSSLPPACPGNLPEALSVGATTPQGRVSDHSRSGSAAGIGGGMKPDLVAPGIKVYTCEKGGAYGYHSGTSFATAIVSGVAALLLETNPSFQADELRQLLLASCRLLPDPPDRQGHGLVGVP